MSNPPHITAVLVDYMDGQRLKFSPLEFGVDPMEIADACTLNLNAEYGDDMIWPKRIGLVGDGHTLWHYRPSGDTPDWELG